ncbi:MAG: hypothetical protein HY599_03765 [Candidatus Omnitrophica bacterium]|nr:hypothetical protein [Candidatus Omnitrophota bacterium]
MDETHPEPRSLIVLCRDPGEVGLARYFLREQAFAKGAVAVLPCDPSLFSAWRLLPVPAFPYATGEDLLALVHSHEPDVVFFFSAYLFALEGLLSPKALDTLLGQLRDRGCRVVTSDPFLGMGPHLAVAQIDTRMLAPGEPWLKRWLLRLWFGLSRRRTKVLRAPSLEDVPHLYPHSIPDRDDHIPRMSFFNPTIIRGAVGAPAVGDGRAQGDALDGRPRWLFVLSARDVHVQGMLVGLREFTERLLGMLRHALEADRHPTLIAPSWLIRRLANALPASAELLSSCPSVEFEQRMLDAEYVFSWNPFSFSLLARVANELPVFVIDRGFLARTVKPYYDLARACYLGGWEPTYLDQRQLFSPYVLAHLARGQKPMMRELRERWLSSPTPDAVVEQLLGTGAPSKST